MTNYTHLNDTELLALLLQDDMGAFTGIYNRYWKKIYTSIHSVLHNTATAQDIVQDIFISLWERRFELKIDYLPAYLHQAARFQVFKAIRNNKADEGFYQRLAIVADAMVSEDPLLLKELTEGINNSLACLPDDHRTVFLLSREQDLSYREIAVKWASLLKL